MRRTVKLLSLLMAVIMMMAALPLTAYAATLPAPSNIKGSVTEDSLTLTWGAVSGASAYRVYKYKSGEYKKYADVAETKCVVLGLSPATTYKFRIAALVKSGGSYKVQTKSPVIKATTAKSSSPTTLKLAKPKKIYLDYKTNKRVDLRWEKVANAKKYEVYYKSENDKKYKKHSTVSANEVIIENLKPGTFYEFKVRAVATSNGETVTGKYSDVISTVTKAYVG